MKYLAITAAALFLFAAPGAFAQDTDGSTDDATGSTSSKGGPDCPAPAAGQIFDNFSEACRNEINIWAEKQTSASVAFEGDVAVGTVLPETVEIIEVPAYRSYGYVVLNDRRVLVDRDTRTVVRVF